MLNHLAEYIPCPIIMSNTEHAEICWSNTHQNGNFMNVLNWLCPFSWPKDQHSPFETSINKFLFYCVLSTNLHTSLTVAPSLSNYIILNIHPHSKGTLSKRASHKKCKYTLFNFSHLKTVFIKTSYWTIILTAYMWSKERVHTFLGVVCLFWSMCTHTMWKSPTCTIKSIAHTYSTKLNNQFCSTSNLTFPVFSRFWIMLVSPSATLGV